jgi:outer membrane protein assembly factor BamB
LSDVSVRASWVLMLVLILSGCQTIQFERPHVLSETDWPTEGRTDARNRTVQDSLTLPLEEVWRYSANAGFGAGSPLILQDRALVGTRKGEVHTITIETGRGAGFKQMGESVEGSPLIYEGLMFVPVAWGRHILVAFDLAKGTNKWRAKGVPFATTLVDHGDTVVGVDLEGTLRAYDIQDGSESWALSLAPYQSFKASPIRLSESSVLLADISGTLYRVNLDSREIEWTLSVDSPVYQTPAVDGSDVVVTTTRGRVLAIDAYTGDTKWEWVGALHLRMGAPALSSSSVVVGATDGRVMLLDRLSGQLQWEARFDDVISAAPLIVGPTVFVATLGKELAGLDVRTGEFTWRTELEGRVKSAMAVAEGGLLVLTEPKWVVYFKPINTASLELTDAEATE